MSPRWRPFRPEPETGRRGLHSGAHGPSFGRAQVQEAGRAAGGAADWKARASASRPLSFASSVHPQPRLLTCEMGTPPPNARGGRRQHRAWAPSAPKKTSCSLWGYLPSPGESERRALHQGFCERSALPTPAQGGLLPNSVSSPCTEPAPCVVSRCWSAAQGRGARRCTQKSQEHPAARPACQGWKGPGVRRGECGSSAWGPPFPCSGRKEPCSALGSGTEAALLGRPRSQMTI